MGFLSRVLAPFRAKAHVEGAPHDGPYHLPVSGGWLPSGTPWNFWQTGQDVRPYGQHSAMVEACVSAYAQTIAMCPGDHWWLDPQTGGRQRQVLSALTRVLRKPNEYQTISDFLLNLVRGLYTEGNAYALALRNARNEITELHLMNPRQCTPLVAVTGDVFYDLGGNELVERRFESERLRVPARDVLHVRLHTPRHPLKGESPIMAAALDVAASNSMMARQLAFFTNQSRPSAVLTTDAPLTVQQMTELRAAWDNQTKGANAGGTPILAHGLKPQFMATSAKDAELAETMKMSEQHIALAFRVPLQILGIGGTPYASTEALMQSWRATGLGFALNHIEEAFGILFGLKGQPEEYVEFNTSSLLRANFAERVDGLTKGIIGGLYSPDEARAEMELPKVPGGHGEEPRVQQQVVPLSFALDPPAPPAPPEPPAPTPAPEAEPEENADAERYAPDAIVQRLRANARLH